MSAKIIAVYNQKGGCGKSAASMQLGGAMALLGLRVWVVDMDPQGTSTIWSANSDADNPFPATVTSLAPLHDAVIAEVEKHFDEYDVILIDCPPAIESSIPWAALQIAHIGLIPVVPVLDNVWAARKAKDLYLRARANNPALQVFYLASIVTRGKIFEHCRTLLENDPEVSLLKAQLSRRNAFPESQVFGSIVGLLDAKSAATQEVNALTAEILGILGIKPRKAGKRSAGKGSEK